MIKWLLITLIVVFVWSGFASYWYVCNVRGLCSSKEIAKISEEKQVVEEVKVPEKEILLAENEENFQPEVVAEKEPVYVPKLQDYFIAYLNLENSSIINLEEFQNFITNLNQFKNEISSIYVIGYTNDSFSIKKSFNRGLDLANYIQDILIKEGFHKDDIITGSRGKFDPLYENTSNDSFKNIRVEISLNKGV
jgi:outer membrane protein OmpA-like peptidoglycan-associated protein